MKKTIKLTFQITVALVIVLLVTMVVTGCMILLRGVGSTGECTHLIVLGNKSEGSTPSPLLRDRIDAAAKYMEKNPNVIAVATGYQSKEADISEARMIYNGLTERGIAPERILLEEQASSTRENFQFSLELLENKYGTVPKKLGVVSSEFHLLRVNMIAKDLQLDVRTVPAGTSDTQAFFTYFVREIFMVWLDGIKVAIF